MKGEFVNFGLITVGKRANSPEVIDVRFTKDRSRILRLDPGADVELLTDLQEQLRREIGQAIEEATFLKKMEASFSGVIQIARLGPAWTERAAAEEIDIVAKAYLEASKQERVREPAGRRWILELMNDEFDKAGVLPLVRAVPVEPYTKAGDPFEFDFGYRVGESIKLFHAVSMRAGVDAAVLLAARGPKILPVMAKITQTTPLLSAIVEAELDRNKAEVRFALEMMEESAIRVLDTSDVAEIASQARRDLKV